MNKQWLDKALQERGISLYKLKKEFRIAPETLQRWGDGKPAFPSTVRKLAVALGMDYDTVRRGLGVVVLTTSRIRRTRVLKAKEAQGILARAERTGRVLPAGMKESLEQTASKSKLRAAK